MALATRVLVPRTTPPGVQGSPLHIVGSLSFNDMIGGAGPLVVASGANTLTTFLNLVGFSNFAVLIVLAAGGSCTVAVVTRTPYGVGGVGTNLPDQASTAAVAATSTLIRFGYNPPSPVVTAPIMVGVTALRITGTGVGNTNVTDLQLMCTT